MELEARSLTAKARGGRSSARCWRWAPLSRLLQPALNLRIIAAAINRHPSQTAVADTKIPATALEDGGVIARVLEGPDRTALVVPAHQITVKRQALKDAANRVVVGLKQMTIALLIPTTDAGIEQNLGRFSAAMGLG